MKPDRLLCYMFFSFFGPQPCTMFNSIAIIWNLLTNRNIALIYSVTMRENKGWFTVRAGLPEINCHTVVFIFEVCRLSK